MKSWILIAIVAVATGSLVFLSYHLFLLIKKIREVLKLLEDNLPSIFKKADNILEEVKSTTENFKGLSGDTKEIIENYKKNLLLINKITKELTMLFGGGLLSLIEGGKTFLKAFKKSEGEGEQIAIHFKRSATRMSHTIRGGEIPEGNQ